MLNRSASLAMSTCVLKALPGKLDIKRLSPSILYLCSKSQYLRCVGGKSLGYTKEFPELLLKEGTRHGDFISFMGNRPLYLDFML